MRYRMEQKIKSLTTTDTHEQTRKYTMLSHGNKKLKSLTIKNNKQADKYIQLLTIGKNTIVKRNI